MAETIALNIAYMLYVASGFITTFIRLRLVMIAVSIAFTVWALIAGVWSAVIWNTLFGAVHCYELIKLWAQRRTIDLTKTQADIHTRLFPDLDLMDFYTLWSVGDSRDVEAGSTLINEGQRQQTVMLILAGEVAVEKDGVRVATLGHDAFVGERSYVTGDAANATVRAVDELTIHEWNQDKIQALTGLCPKAHDSMVRQIGRDLATKL